MVNKLSNSSLETTRTLTSKTTLFDCRVQKRLIPGQRESPAKMYVPHVWRLKCEGLWEGMGRNLNQALWVELGAKYGGVPICA